MNEAWTEILKAIGSGANAGGMDAITGSAGVEATTEAAVPVQMVGGALQAPSSSVATGDGGDSPLIEGMSRLTAGVEQLRLAASAQVDSLLANTDAVSRNTAAQASKGANSAVSTLGKIFSPILQMSGVGSLVSGIVHLFGGGGDSAAPAPLTPYAAPPKIYYQGVISSQTQAPAATVSASEEKIGIASSGPGIQISVNAMDSRSFMDHSDEIASAVREALLRAHPLNDLINEGE